MPTIKEQLDHIQEYTKDTEALAATLTDLANRNADVITKALKHNLKTCETIDGYLISIKPEPKSYNRYPRYNITIKEPMQTRLPICYFEGTFVATDTKIVCTVDINNQRLSHGQIEELITKAFGF